MRISHPCAAQVTTSRCRTNKSSLGRFLQTRPRCLTSTRHRYFTALYLGEQDDLDLSNSALQVNFTYTTPLCLEEARLVQVGELTSCGEHDVAICRVEGMVVPDQSAEGAATMGDALSTARLRELGMISDRGKAVSPPELQ